MAVTYLDDGSRQVLCQAIDRRRGVAFIYAGSLRVGEPFTHGVSLAGREVIRVWQYGGQSRSTELPTWRLFTVSKISKAVILDDHVTDIDRLDNDGGIDAGMTSIHCAIQKGGL